MRSRSTAVRRAGAGSTVRTSASAWAAAVVPQRCGHAKHRRPRASSTFLVTRCDFVRYGTVVDDALGLGVADARQRLQLGGAGAVDVDELGRGAGSRLRRARRRRRTGGSGLGRARPQGHVPLATRSTAQQESDGSVLHRCGKTEKTRVVADPGCGGVGKEQQLSFPRLTRLLVNHRRIDDVARRVAGGAGFDVARRQPSARR